ncbi:MAG: tRNA (guanosine(46)-N7)-methyltransferase TrmB [Planctomycetes bacterium]|nr:tRNA (guanosine(46)-N7)-methyltransferase TrmB [Planctomycetota bacterium]
MSQSETPADLRPWFLTLGDLDGPLDWRQFFGNSNPVEIDVGSGRGMFLVNSALARPDTNFLGIEIDYREGRRAARRLMKRELPNARVLGGDVHQAFDRFVPPHSVQAMYVYFPDPWWKRKHRRRRVFTDDFADRCARALHPGGLLHSWSDVGEYFEIIRSLMDHHADFEPLPPPPEREPEHDMDYQTSYERKGRQTGGTVHRGLWRRR